MDEIYKELRDQNYTCDKIHGGMEQRDRTTVMEKFRAGQFRYLVATDVAARGIDVDNISHVINYDVPFERESYVHRIGRTGRVGKKGKAITFITSKEEELIREIEDYIETGIAIVEKPSQDEVYKLKSEFEDKKSKRPEVKEQKENKNKQKKTQRDLQALLAAVKANAATKTCQKARRAGDGPGLGRVPGSVASSPADSGKEPNIHTNKFPV